ncbi:MAG TPA: IS200/IS605 family transposase [Thermoanaerobaculia bacterium]|nr:IS200/IS605 family transposase [Thermoanaerobaculia bacterium]
MAHTYTSLLVHCVFSTKRREPHLKPDIRQRLWPFMGGIARENKMRALAVGGYFDHAHLLLSVPPTWAIAKAMQVIKAGSSKFVHETFPKVRGFEWQEGYGAFSISISAVNETIAYIHGQEEHHRGKTFQEEYIAFLKKHGIEYDERYVFD